MRTLGVVATSGLAILLAFLSGCGTTKNGYTPTRGQVFNGTKPAEGAQVTLVAIDGKDEPASRPAGVVGADGAFSLSTYDPATRQTHEGAPPGKYAVLVSWYPQAGLGGLDAASPKSADRLSGRYKDATTSPFRIEVKDEPTELEPITISESGPKAKTGSPFG